MINLQHFTWIRFHGWHRCFPHASISGFVQCNKSTVETFDAFVCCKFAPLSCTTFAKGWSSVKKLQLCHSPKVHARLLAPLTYLANSLPKYSTGCCLDWRLKFEDLDLLYMIKSKLSLLATFKTVELRIFHLPFEREWLQHLPCLQKSMLSLSSPLQSSSSLYLKERQPFTAAKCLVSFPERPFPWISFTRSE